MEELAELLARERIRELTDRYAVAIDARDLDALIALFVPDVDCGQHGSGRMALRGTFARQLRGSGPTVMLVGNHVIDFEDDTHARGIVYSSVEAARPEGWIRQAVRYHDRYERRDGRWLFVRREHHLFYGVVLPYDPMAQPPAEWPRRQVGRGTVPWCLDSWRRFDGEEHDPD